MLASLNLGRDQLEEELSNGSDIGKSNSLKTKSNTRLMTTKQLNKEYAETMHQAAEASGRRETLELYKKAKSIKKELYGDDPEYPLIHCG